MLPRFVGSAFKPRQRDVKAAQMETSAVNLLSHRLETLLEDGEFVLCRSGQPIDTTVPARSVIDSRRTSVPLRFS
jgi:hypothetical protein